jgi:hypothetical protein
VLGTAAPPFTPPPGAKRLPLRHVTLDADPWRLQLPTVPFRVVAESAAAWQPIWQMAAGNRGLSGLPTPAPPSPPIDFARERVAVAINAMDYTDGRGLAIRDVFASRDTLWILVRNTEPGPACLQSTIEYVPSDAVVIPKGPTSVVWRELRETVNC